jgi:hypothetical protein
MGGSACLAMCASNTDCYPTAGYGCSDTKECASYCIFDSDNYDDGCIYAP